MRSIILVCPAIFIRWSFKKIINLSSMGITLVNLKSSDLHLYFIKTYQLYLFDFSIAPFLGLTCRWFILKIGKELFFYKDDINCIFQSYRFSWFRGTCLVLFFGSFEGLQMNYIRCLYDWFSLLYFFYRSWRSCFWRVLRSWWFRGSCR